MPEAKEITYAALITIELPGMRYPATITVSLRPPDTIEVAPGRVKPLRDCSLAELEAFAEALEADIWEQHRSALLGELAAGPSQLKITILDESGQPLELEKAQVLEHAIAFPDEPSPTSVEQETEATKQHDDAPQDSEEPTAEAEPDAKDVSEPVAAEESAAATTEPEEPVAESPESVEAPDDQEQATPAGEQAPPRVEEEPAESTPDTGAVAEPPVQEAAQPSAPAPARPRIAGLRRPLGHPTPAAVDILINESAFRDAQAHALSSLDREVAGMLIGPRPEKQPDGRYVVHVSDVIIAKHTRMHGASVTYTPESWRYVTDKLAERYPNEEAVIVGWYHTHPGFGIFLSGMDLFIHQNFFTQKWHIALVLDPLARTSGFFCWNRKQTEVQAYDFPWPEWARDRW